MRKLILMTVLSLFSAVAFSQEAAPAEVVAPVVAQETPGSAAPSESTAKKAGTWLGRIVKTPVSFVKELSSGIREGYSGHKTETTVASTVSQDASASAAVPAAPDAAASVPVTKVAMADVRSAPSVFALVRDRIVAARAAQKKQSADNQLQSSSADHSVSSDAAVN